MKCDGKCLENDPIEGHIYQKPASRNTLASLLKRMQPCISDSKPIIFSISRATCLSEENVKFNCTVFSFNNSTLARPKLVCGPPQNGGCDGLTSYLVSNDLPP